MLHIVTAFSGPTLVNMAKIYSSIPDHADITWHVIIPKGIPESELVVHIIPDNRMKVYRSDRPLSSGIKDVFAQIDAGYFHLLDSETIFFSPMYDTYQHLQSMMIIGMLIGAEAYKNMDIHLFESVPGVDMVGLGNVICHSSVLSRVKWTIEQGSLGPVFWKQCFDYFGSEKTILIPDIISIFKFLSPIKQVQ